MSAPNLKYGHPDSEEAKAKAAERLAHEKGLERRAWLTLWHTYERCVAISELVWKSKLEEASAQQQALAESMRDREHGGLHDDLEVLIRGSSGKGRIRELLAREIPGPLFTPPDRHQFIKKGAPTLLISP